MGPPSRMIVFYRVLLALGVLFLWEAATGGLHPRVVLVDPFFVSSPRRITLDLVEGFSRGTLVRDTAVTLVESVYGLALGMGSGLGAGLALAFWRSLDRLLAPFIGIANSIPRPALAPLAILWFGLGMASKVFIAWSLVFFVTFYSTYQGVKSIDPDLVNAIRVMRPTRLQMMRIVVLPAVFAWVFAGFRLSVAYALIGAIVGEFVGATAGLGYQLVLAQGLLDTDRVFSVLALTGVLAASGLAAAERLESALLKWRPVAQLGP